MFTMKFWRSAIERAVKSFAQALAALLGAGGIGLLDAPWARSLSLAGMTGLLSLLTSIACLKVGAANDPSCLPAPAPQESAIATPVAAAA